MRFLKEWFKNTFVKSSYSNYLQLDRKLSEKRNQLEELAKGYSEFKQNCDYLIKGTTTESGLEMINSRYNKYYSEYIENIKDIKYEIDILKSELSTILKANPSFEKEEQSEFVKATIVLIEAWEAGLISESQFKEIQKRSQERIIEKGWFPEEIKQHFTKILSTPQVLYSDMIIENNRGEILLLLRNKQSDFSPGKWCLPGGHIDKGETPLQAAIRELSEETGIQVKEQDVNLVEELDIEKGKIHYFYTCLSKDVEVRLLEEEHINYIWCKNYSQLDLIMNLSEILDRVYIR
jgi:mutator protein MutT